MHSKMSRVEWKITLIMPVTLNVMAIIDALTCIFYFFFNPDFCSFPSNIYLLIFGLSLYFISIYTYLIVASSDPGRVQEVWKQENMQNLTFSKEEDKKLFLTRHPEYSNIYSEKNNLNSSIRYQYCTYCDAPKPPRTHHCKICKICYLKMDHHCPFLGNCIGLKNHKNYSLVLLYASIATAYEIIFTLYGIYTELNKESNFHPSIVLIMFICFMFALIIFLGMFLLLSFHTYFIFNSLTTIERTSESKKRFSRCCLLNLKTTLGTDLSLWFIPTNPVFDFDENNFPSNKVPNKICAR